MADQDRRYYLTTQLAADDLPALPDRCQACGAGVVVRYDRPDGTAGGRCEQDCGWTFSRIAFDKRV